VDSLSVLRELARVLRVDVDDLAPSTTAPSHGPSQPGGVEIEWALFAPSAGAPTSATEVVGVHATYQDARYVNALEGLPRFMTQLAAADDARLLVR
jgi:hypothetical protein